MPMEMPTMLVAIVTMEKDNFKGGGVPIFITNSKDSLQEISSSLEKVLDASAHEVNQSTIILVAH